MTRAEKLAQLAELAAGVRWGMPAFDARLAEMGPGPAARGAGPSTKGGSSSPVEGEVIKPARVVESQFARLLDRAHAAVVELEDAYGEIARTQRGRAAEGAPSCAWCDEAVLAAAKKAKEAKDGRAPIPLDYRSPTYLYAKVKAGARTERKLVCEWCYRFSLREERKPTIEERWVHAQGGRMPKMKAAPRVSVEV